MLKAKTIARGAPSPRTRPAKPRSRLVSVRPVGTVLCIAAADLASILLAVLIAESLRNSITGKVPALTPGLGFSVVVFTLCSFVAARLYPGILENPVDELRKTTLATSLAFLSLGASPFVSPDFSKSRLVVLLACVITLALVPMLRSMVRSGLASRAWWGCPTVIMGMGDIGKQVLTTLREIPRTGLKPVAILDDDPSTYEGYEEGIVVGPLASCFEVTRSCGASYGIVCM